MTSIIKVTIIPVLQDNYAYLLEAGDNGPVAIIDPGQAAPIERVLEERNLELNYILNTHHHGDHIAGNAVLKKKYKARILGPESESSRIADMDEGFKDGEIFLFGGEEIEIIATPGHTCGAICYYLRNSNIIFTGDTLFSLGCGRLFEGTPEQMHNSLCRIAALPDETQIYCGHEYTLANARFCEHVAPDNNDLKERIHEVRTLRSIHQPTLPVELSVEKKTNVFLMAKDANEFARLRRLKDSF